MISIIPVKTLPVAPHTRLQVTYSSGFRDDAAFGIPAKLWMSHVRDAEQRVSEEATGFVNREAAHDKLGIIAERKCE